MRGSSSSSYDPHDDVNLANRLKTIFKKAYELSVLCDIEVSVIYYGPDGKLKTWPEKDKVKDMALRYKASTKRKKCQNLHEFLEKGKKKQGPKKKKMKREYENVRIIKYPTWYPIFDHYSPDQLSELIVSLEKTLCTLKQRLRVVETQKQRNTNVAHEFMNQPLNPNQFSLCVYNHGDATISKLPLTDYQIRLMMQQPNLYGLDHNNINNKNFQQPCFSNTQYYSTLLTGQDSAVNNHLMQQHEINGFDQNMSMMKSDITNSYNVQQHPCLSNNTVSDVSCSGLQKNNPYSVMLGSSSSSLSQGTQNTFSSHDEITLIQTPSLPSPQTNPNPYLLSHNSMR